MKLAEAQFSARNRLAKDYAFVAKRIGKVGLICRYGVQGMLALTRPVRGGRYIETRLGSYYRTMRCGRRRPAAAMGSSSHGWALIFQGLAGIRAYFGPLGLLTVSLTILS